MRFTTREILPVVQPYRLDLTVDALRRLASNAVDVVGDDGAYYRALSVDGEPEIVRVMQLDDERIEVQASGSRARHAAAIVRRMLGVDVEIVDWLERSARIPWLARIADECRGVKPPRYPTLWEATCYAIVFQQISIHAASAIMGRLVEALGVRLDVDGTTLHTFPTPAALLDADDAVLKAAGLSTNKRVHLRAVADAILGGDIDEAKIERLPTAAAAEELVRVRGIGPWSAAIVLLRGFGRLDTFPMRDSGVARTIKLLSGDPGIDVDAVLDILGPTRGMLYFHLLLGRLRNLVPEATD
jgi:DNA-3-methyladenine glycosylase II